MAIYPAENGVYYVAMLASGSLVFNTKNVQSWMNAVSYTHLADPEAEHLPKTPIRKFVDLYKSLIETVRQAGKKIVVLNLPPLDENKYFKWISRGRSAENILKWLGGATRFIYHWQESYSVAVSGIANALQVPLLSLIHI